jgi:hypothetical protein
VKVVPPLALHAGEPLDRFIFILPGQPIPSGLDVLVVPREQQVVPATQFRRVAASDQWQLYSTGTGCAAGLQPT